MKMIDIQKRVGDFCLRIPELRLEGGCIHGLIGGNGCGKTTLAKLMMGILTPDSGRIDREGLTGREITMTAQRPYLMHASVYENAAYPLKLRGMKPKEADIRPWLARCGLWEKKDQYAGSLSGGERQKLSMIRAMIFRPKLIIVDETLSNLDPDSVELFEQWIREIQEQSAVTWVMISHQLSHIYRMCDQIHFLSQGELAVSGPAREVIRSCGEERLRAFLDRELLKVHDGKGNG